MKLTYNYTPGHISITAYTGEHKQRILSAIELPLDKEISPYTLTKMLLEFVIEVAR